MSRRKRFGEILVEAGVVDEATLERALQNQKGTGKRLGQVLEELGVVSERDIAAVLARQFGYKTVRGIASHAFADDLLELIPSEEALKKLIFPLKRSQGSLFLAVVNPLDMETLDNLSFRTGLRLVLCVTTPSEIHQAVARHYLKEGEGEEGEWWTILVADDQELARSAVIAALVKQGYTVRGAANGAEALKAVYQSAPHLIVSDTVMPRMDGYEMFRTLQSKPATAGIPVIALSSRSSAEEEAKLLGMGFFDFVAKPINPVRLVARVQRALRLHYGSEHPPD